MRSFRHPAWLAPFALLGALAWSQDYAPRSRTLAELEAECVSLVDQGGDPRSFEKLKAFTRRHRPADSTELLKLLRSPEGAGQAGVLRSHVLMKKSDSAQAAATDPDHPRMIFFQEGMILALTGHTDPKADAINRRAEIIRYNYSANEWEFKTIRLSRQGPIVDEHPRDCRGCHGTPLRPLWRSYLTWPGAYSFSSYYEYLSTVEKDEEERKLRHQISQLEGDLALSAEEQSSRIEKLKDALDASVYEQRVLAPPYTFVGKSEGGENAAELNRFLNALNFRRIAARLRKARSFARTEYAAVAALIGCPDLPSFVGSRKAEAEQLRYLSLLTDTEATVRAEFAATLARAREIGDDEAARHTTMNDEKDILPVAGLRFLFENRGVDLRGFSLNRSPGPKTHGWGFHATGYYNDGIEHLACAFLPELIRNDPRLLPLANLSLYDEQPPEMLARSCALLKAKSLEHGGRR